jgi:hypothetical protein
MPTDCIIGKKFKPTVSDLKMLIGTKEWADIKIELGIDEKSPDPGAPKDDEDDDVEGVKSDHFDGESGSGGGASS